MKQPTGVVRRLGGVTERTVRVMQRSGRVIEQVVRVVERMVRAMEQVVRVVEQAGGPAERPVRIIEQVVRVIQRPVGMTEWAVRTYLGHMFAAALSTLGAFSKAGIVLASYAATAVASFIWRIHARNLGGFEGRP